MGLPELLILIVVLVGGSLWVWMIIDCATREPSLGAHPKPAIDDHLKTGHRE
jgi:hypothetical protein